MTSENDEYNVTETSLEIEYNDSDVFYENDTDDTYEFYAVPQIVLVSILCVFIIVGNSCVLAAIRLSERGRKSRMNFFIMHLAIADLLVGVMVCVADLANKITIDWYAGNALCKIIQYSQAVVTYASTYMLVSLSIDRYDAVARPMNFSRSGHQGRCLVYMAWLVSFVFALPALFIYKEDMLGGRKQCWVDFPLLWHWQLFVTAVTVVTFLVPAIIIASCYIAIIYIIWSKGQSHEPHRPVERIVSHQGGVSTPTRSTFVDKRRETGRGIIPQAKIRTIKMTLIIVIVFIMCWSPYFLYNLLDIYELLPFNNPIATFFQSAAPLNSAANPIIYGIFSTRICKNLRRIPMPACVREMVCRCKETRKCNRLTFRGRNHKFMASQTTDPTLTTFEAHKKSNQCLNMKPSDRRYATLITKHILDRTIFGETAADLLKHRDLDKKQTFFKIPRTKWISEKIACEYEMAPLTRKGLIRHIVSSGSEESSGTTDSTVRPVQLPNSKRILEIKILSERNEKNIDAPVKKMKSKKTAIIKLCGENEHNEDIKVSNKGLQTCTLNMDKSHQKKSEISKTSPAKISTRDHKCETHETQSKREEAQIFSNFESIPSLANVCMLHLEQYSKQISDKGNELVEDLSRDIISPNGNELCINLVESVPESQSRAPEKRLANRRPSGVPTIRRRLTPDESAILNNLAEKWLVKEVRLDESSTV